MFPEHHPTHSLHHMDDGLTCISEKPTNFTYNLKKKNKDRAFNNWNPDKFIPFSKHSEAICMDTKKQEKGSRAKDKIAELSASSLTVFQWPFICFFQCFSSQPHLSRPSIYFSFFNLSSLQTECFRNGCQLSGNCKIIHYSKLKIVNKWGAVLDCWSVASAVLYYCIQRLH